MPRKKSSRKKPITKPINQGYYEKLASDQAKKFEQQEKDRLVKRKKEARRRALKDFFEKILVGIILWPGMVIIGAYHKELDLLWDYYSFNSIRISRNKPYLREEIRDTVILYVGAILWLIVLPLIIF